MRKLVKVANMLFDPDEVISFNFFLRSPEDNCGIEPMNYYRIIFKTAQTGPVVEMSGEYALIKPQVDAILAVLNYEA